MSALEAFDLIVHSEQLERRIAATAGELSKNPNWKDEAAWLEIARRRIEDARAGLGAPRLAAGDFQRSDLLTRVLRLPELEPLRAERGRALQEAALEAVDNLHATIRKAAGERSPVIDVLYMNLKLLPLRKAGRDVFEAFCIEFERRLASGYLTRMFADENYLPAAPALQEVRRSFDIWHTVFASPPLPDAEATALRDELTAFAEGVDLRCRQAILLADAALLSAEHLRESCAIFDKPRKRRI